VAPNSLVVANKAGGRVDALIIKTAEADMSTPNASKT